MRDCSTWRLIVNNHEETCLGHSVRLRVSFGDHFQNLAAGVGQVCSLNNN